MNFKETLNRLQAIGLSEDKSDKWYVRSLSLDDTSWGISRAVKTADNKFKSETYPKKFRSYEKAEAVANKLNSQTSVSEGVESKVRVYANKFGYFVWSPKLYSHLMVFDSKGNLEDNDPGYKTDQDKLSAAKAVDMKPIEFSALPDNAKRVIGRTIFNQGLAEDENLELYGLRIGDTVTTKIDGQRVQGDIIDIFLDDMEVELLLRGPETGRTVVVDVRDTEIVEDRGVAEGSNTSRVWAKSAQEAYKMLGGKLPKGFAVNISVNDPNSVNKIASALQSSGYTTEPDDSIQDNGIRVISPKFEGGQKAQAAFLKLEDLVNRLGGEMTGGVSIHTLNQQGMAEGADLDETHAYRTAAGHTVEPTKTGLKHTRSYSDDDEEDEVSRGRGRPRKGADDQGHVAKHDSDELADLLIGKKPTSGQLDKLPSRRHSLKEFMEAVESSITEDEGISFQPLQSQQKSQIKLDPNIKQIQTTAKGQQALDQLMKSGDLEAIQENSNDDEIDGFAHSLIRKMEQLDSGTIAWYKKKIPDAENKLFSIARDEAAEILDSYKDEGIGSSDMNAFAKKILDIYIYPELVAIDKEQYDADYGDETGEYDDSKRYDNGGHNISESTNKLGSIIRANQRSVDAFLQNGEMSEKLLRDLHYYYSVETNQIPASTDDEETISDLFYRDIEEQGLKESYSELFLDDVDTGEYDARKTTPSSSEHHDGIFARFRELQKNLEKEESDKVDLDESDANWAKSKEAEKEKRLDPSDRDKLAKIRTMMAKEKKPMRKEEVEEIEEIKDVAKRYLDKTDKEELPGASNVGLSDKMRRKIHNRVVGVNRAMDRTHGKPAYYKEEVDEGMFDTIKAGFKNFMDPDYEANKQLTADEKQKFQKVDALIKHYAKMHGGDREAALDMLRSKMKDHSVEDLYSLLSPTKLSEKINMKTADMGDVIKDFYKSDAPQFKGKSKAERRQMAIAAKLGAERGNTVKEAIDSDDTYIMTNPDFGKDEETGREEPEQIEVKVDWSSYGDEFELDKVVRVDTDEDITDKVFADEKLYWNLSHDVQQNLQQKRSRGDYLEEDIQYGEQEGSVQTSKGKLSIIYRFQINKIVDADGDDITDEMSKDPWGTRYLKQAVFNRIADSEPLKIGQNRTITTTDYKGPKTINYDWQLVSATGPRGDDVTELLLNSPSARNHFIRAFLSQQVRQMQMMRESDNDPVSSREASYAASALGDTINKNLDKIRGYVNDVVNYAKTMSKKYANRGIEGAEDSIANLVNSYENLKRSILALRNPYDAIATGSPERYLQENVEDIPAYTAAIKREIGNLQDQLDFLFQKYSAMAQDVKEPSIEADMKNSLKFVKDPQTKINQLLIAIEQELLDPFDIFERTGRDQLYEGTIQEIEENYPYEAKQFKEGWGMDQGMYEALCNHYHREGRIPSVVWHGPLQELRDWVEECYATDMGLLLGEADNYELTQHAQSDSVMSPVPESEVSNLERTLRGATKQEMDETMYEAKENKKWIKGAIKDPGAFTKKAKRHGMTTSAFAKKVIANPEDYPSKTEKQAHLAQTLSKMNESSENESYEEWNTQLAQLLAEGQNVSISLGNEHGPDTVTVTATDEDAHELVKLLQNAGMGGTVGTANAIATAIDADAETPDSTMMSVATPQPSGEEVEVVDFDAAQDDLGGPSDEDRGDEALGFLKRMLGQQVDFTPVETDVVDAQSADSCGSEEVESHGDFEQEEVELDEAMSDDDKSSIALKALVAKKNLKQAGNKVKSVDFYKRMKDRIKAGEDLKKQEVEEIEEDEQLDEISPDTLKNYIDKAESSKDIHQALNYIGLAHARAPEDKYDKKFGRKEAGKHQRIVNKRQAGIDAANKRLKEDDVEEGNKFSGELAKARASGKDSFEVDGKEYKVDESDEKSKTCNECGGIMYEGEQHKCEAHDHDKSAKLDEWANSANDQGSDEAFQAEIDYMTKLISGGLNGPKRDQTVAPKTQVKVVAENDNVVDFAAMKRLAGIK